MAMRVGWWVAGALALAGCKSGNDAQLVEKPKTLSDVRKNGLLSRGVTHEDIEGLNAFFKERDELVRKQEYGKLLDQDDFPIIFATDTAKGEPVVEQWGKLDYVQVMMKAGPYFPEAPLEHSDRKYVFLTNDLVIAYQTDTVTLNGETHSWKSANVLVRRDGKWKNKAVIEGGVGDFLKMQDLTSD